MNYTADMVSGYVEKLNLSCYRQDFNTDPLEFWRKNDAHDRCGITEIKHIMGLYRFWDILLERFPELIIDNCASGGRRIDIETLKRSIPLWRSDCQCIWDHSPEISQTHNSGISWWLPYTGTGTGSVINDTYRLRSAYSAALAVNYWGYEHLNFSEKDVNWVRKYIKEYKSVREYFSYDYYPLINHSLDCTNTLPALPSAEVDNSGWTASQYDRPEHGDGIILAFRRYESPFPMASVYLGGISDDKTYHFKDADSEEEFSISGKVLVESGFTIHIPEKRSSRLYLYTAKLNSCIE